MSGGEGERQRGAGGGASGRGARESQGGNARFTPVRGSSCRRGGWAGLGWWGEAKRPLREADLGSGCYSRLGWEGPKRHCREEFVRCHV